MSPWMKWMRTTLLSSLVMYSMLSRLITLSPTRSNILMVHLLPPKSRVGTPRRIPLPSLHSLRPGFAPRSGGRGSAGGGEAQGTVERGMGDCAASKGGAGSRPLLRRGTLHNGFPFSLRSALVIHDSEFLSRPTISCLDSYASGLGYTP